MSDKLLGGVRAGSTSVSLPVSLKAQSTGAGQTGIAFGSATAYYLRQGGSPVAIGLSALGGIAAAFSAGGWFEADSVHMPGLYRLDVPDAAFAAGADWVDLVVFAASGQPYVERIPLTSEALLTGDPYALLNNSVEAIGAGSLGTLNYSGIMRMLIATCIALANGGATGQINLRDQANSKNRISFTVDANGNRTAMVVDLT